MFPRDSAESRRLGLGFGWRLDGPFHTRGDLVVGIKKLSSQTDDAGVVHSRMIKCWSVFESQCFVRKQTTSTTRRVANLRLERKRKLSHPLVNTARKLSTQQDTMEANEVERYDGVSKCQHGT